MLPEDRGDVSDTVVHKQAGDGSFEEKHGTRPLVPGDALFRDTIELVLLAHIPGLSGGNSSALNRLVSLAKASTPCICSKNHKIHV
jgi:hypothetical protein